MSKWIRLIGGLHNGEVEKIDDDQVEVIKRKKFPPPSARVINHAYGLESLTSEVKSTRYTRRVARRAERSPISRSKGLATSTRSIMCWGLKMKQSKLMSWVETCLNTGIGFAIAIATQILVFPLFGYDPPLSTNFKIALVFTVVSIVRGYVLRRLFEALHIRRPMSPFVQATIAECFRQKEVEGFDVGHDDKQPVGELAKAGAAYARNAGTHLSETPYEWPWGSEWWKPAGFRRDLVRAAALVIAEGDKFDRSRKQKRSSF